MIEAVFCLAVLALFSNARAFDLAIGRVRSRDLDVRSRVFDEIVCELFHLIRLIHITQPRFTSTTSAASIKTIDMCATVCYL